MRYSEIVTLSALVASAAARPTSMKLSRREVPQEQSHKKVLTKCQEMLLLENPDQIVDVVFGLLGNEAAAQGIGAIADADCLQQASADQAFTNAGDLEGQIAALQYRALERNTGAVGLASVACTAIQAVNPEIAILAQHQDPASDNAAAINKEIVLNLAIIIAQIGGDPLLALETGTFAPGEIGDPTAAGNTCNDENDAEGCIFTEGLLVEDASEAEILAAVEAGVVDNNVDQNVDDNLVNQDEADAAAQAELDAAKEAQAQLDAQAKDDAQAEADKAKAKADQLKQQEDVKNADKDNQKNKDKNDKNDKNNDKNDNKNKNNDKNDNKNKDKNDKDKYNNKEYNEKDKYNNDEYNKEVNRQKNFQIEIVIKIAIQHIFDAQAHAWQLIAFNEQDLQQQFLNQLIGQQQFQQQKFQFDQYIVNNFAIAANQHLGIVDLNQNVINLGGFGAIQQNFLGQLGGIGGVQKLMNFGQVGVGNNVHLAQLLGQSF